MVSDGAHRPFFPEAHIPRGMLCCARSQWLHASLFFAVASSFRSNGIMLAGYILWGLVLGPLLDRKTVRNPFFPPLTPFSSAIEGHPGSCSAGNAPYRTHLRAIHLPSIQRIRHLLCRPIRGCATMVLLHAPARIRLCAGQVLECRLPTLLDAVPGPEHPLGRSGPRCPLLVRRCPRHKFHHFTYAISSPSLVIRKHGPNLVASAKYEVALPHQQKYHTACAARSRPFHGPTICCTHANRASLCRIDANHILGSSVVNGGASSGWKVVGYMECGVGGGLECALGGVSTSCVKCPAVTVRSPNAPKSAKRPNECLIKGFATVMISTRIDEGAR